MNLRYCILFMSLLLLPFLSQVFTQQTRKCVAVGNIDECMNLCKTVMLANYKGVGVRKQKSWILFTTDLLNELKQLTPLRFLERWLATLV